MTRTNEHSPMGMSVLSKHRGGLLLVDWAWILSW